MNHPVERRAAPTQRGAAGTASLVDLMVEGF
jgi:type VI secretion system protein ImpK